MNNNAIAAVAILSYNYNDWEGYLLLWKSLEYIFSENFIVFEMYVYKKNIKMIIVTEKAIYLML